MCPSKFTYLLPIIAARDIIHFVTAGYTPITLYAYICYELKKYVYCIVNNMIIPMAYFSGADVLNGFEVSFLCTCGSILYVS